MGFERRCDVLYWRARPAIPWLFSSCPERDETMRCIPHSDGSERTWCSPYTTDSITFSCFLLRCIVCPKDVYGGCRSTPRHTLKFMGNSWESWEFETIKPRA